jgi:hypothetical protein
VDLLEGLPRPLVSQAEDVLCRLAEEADPPAVSLGVTAADRKKCRDAWAAWWAANQEKADLGRLEKTPRLLGRTLIVLLDQGRVFELDSKDKVLWQLEYLQLPLDVQMLPEDRLLVAEYNNSRVTERTLTGEIKWQRAVNQPIVAQRLANDNTFLASDSQLEEVDAKGKLVFTWAPPNGDRIMKAVKLPTGEALCLLSQANNNGTEGRVVRVDGTGKVVGAFQVTLGTPVFGGRIQGLANGNVLIPHLGEDKVVEYTREGKAVWEVAIKSPIVATRLRNGNTLVTSMDPQNYRAVEFDRTGREVWRYVGNNTRVTRALRR